MTHKLSQEESEPLDQVLDRALKGESQTRGMGPFYLTFFSPYRSPRMCPLPFESVEDALLFLSIRLNDNPTLVGPDSTVAISFCLGSTWVQ